MAPVMPHADSQARAEQAFVMREVGMMSWPKIRDALGFSSVGGAQFAYKRFVAKNRKHQTAETAMAGIVERKRATLGIALKSMAEAQRAGDHPTVARMIDVITRADAELARLYGLSREQVDVTVTETPAAILAETRQRIMAAIDQTPILEAEVVA